MSPEILAGELNTLKKQLQQTSRTSVTLYRQHEKSLLDSIDQLSARIERIESHIGMRYMEQEIISQDEKDRTNGQYHLHLEE